MNAAAGKAFTTVFAGFAFTLVSLPKIILVHAFVAGLVLVLMRQRPGILKIPVFFTSFAATVTRLFKILEQSLVFISCSVAIDFNNSPFVIAFAEPVFIAFMGAMVMTEGLSEAERSNSRLLKLLEEYNEVHCAAKAVLSEVIACYTSYRAVLHSH